MDIFQSEPGRFHVGEVRTGEWLRFSLLATEEFLCQVRYRVASALTKESFLRLEIDGETRDVVVQDYLAGLERGDGPAT